MPPRKDLSSFNISIGISLKQLIEEYPVPKSSIEIENPYVLNSFKTFFKIFNSLIATVSVISISMKSELKLYIFIVLLINFTISGWYNSTLDKFTETGTIFLPCFFHSYKSLQTLSNTNLPIFKINLLFSAIGINTAGLIKPCSGWFHLISASLPIISPVTSENLGW